MPLSVVGEIITDRITLTPGGSALVRTMRAHGGYTALVSGGFTVFTGPISATIGFDEHRSNVLLAHEGVLTGEVADPILGKQAKLDALLELRGRLDLSPAQTLAVGDGANDLAMLGEAGLGAAFRGQARSRRRRPCEARPRRSDGAALCPGLYGRRDRAGLARRVILGPGEAWTRESPARDARVKPEH